MISTKLKVAGAMQMLALAILFSGAAAIQCPEPPKDCEPCDSYEFGGPGENYVWVGRSECDQGWWFPVDPIEAYGVLDEDVDETCMDFEGECDLWMLN